MIGGAHRFTAAGVSALLYDTDGHSVIGLAVRWYLRFRLKLRRGGGVVGRALPLSGSVYRVRLGAEVYPSVSGRSENASAPCRPTLVGRWDIYQSGRALG